MAVGTMVWFTFTTIFEIIEYRSGLCSVTKYLTKAKCAAKGYRWIGFDISGKFIYVFMIYSFESF